MVGENPYVGCVNGSQGIGGEGTFRVGNAEVKN